MKAPEYGARHKRRNGHALESDERWRGEQLGEAARAVEMRRVDERVVTNGVKGQGGVDDEALGAADAEVGVHKGDAHVSTYGRCLTKWRVVRRGVVHDADPQLIGG